MSVRPSVPSMPFFPSRAHSFHWIFTRFATDLALSYLKNCKKNQVSKSLRLSVTRFICYPVNSKNHSFHWIIPKLGTHLAQSDQHATKGTNGPLISQGQGQGKGQGQGQLQKMGPRRCLFSLNFLPSSLDQDQVKAKVKVKVSVGVKVKVKVEVKVRLRGRKEEAKITS